MKLELLDRPIAFHRCFASWTGDAKSALFLSQMLYWNNRTTNADGWFYKTAEDFEEETSLSRREQKRIRQELVQLGFIEEVLYGVPATLHFRLAAGFYAKVRESIPLNEANIDDPVVDPKNGKTRCAQKAKLDGSESTNYMCPKGQTNTEITHRLHSILKNKEKEKEGLALNTPDQSDLIISKWNDTAKECKFPGINKMNPTRSSHLRARLREHPEMVTWETLLANITKMKPLFLSGEMSWFTFDWVIKSPENFDKVMASWLAWRLGKSSRPASHAPEECRPDRKFERVNV